MTYSLLLSGRKWSSNEITYAMDSSFSLNKNAINSLNFPSAS